MNGANFLRGVVAAFPYAIHTLLTDNREAIPRRDVSEADRGMAFADLPKNRGRHVAMGIMFAATSSTASASNTASSTSSPGQNHPIPGPTVRPNA